MPGPIRAPTDAFSLETIANPTAGAGMPFLDRQYDFSDVIGSFHEAMRLARLGQGEGGVNDRPHAPRREQRPDVLADCIGHFGLLRDGSSPQSRAGERQPLGEYQPMLTSARDPPSSEITTMRPSSAAMSRLRAT